MMEKAHVHFENNSKSELKLKVNQAHIYKRSALFGATLLAFLVPLASALYAVFFGEGPHLAYLFILLIFGYLGIHLLKAYLWSSYGEEDMTFSPEGCIYIAIFKHFSGTENRLKYPYYINYDVVWENYNQLEAVLSIYNDEGHIRSNLKLPIDEMEKLYVNLCDEMPWLKDPEVKADVDGAFAVQFS